MLRVEIRTEEFNATVARVRAAGGRVAEFLLVWGNAIAREAREAARQKPGRRFWREVARATRVDRAGADGVSIANWHVAGAHKQTGGPIVAKNARALTIPIAEEARGRRAAEFEAGGRELFAIPGRGGDSVGILGYAEEDGDFHALFALRRRTRPQAPDPWWPTDRRMMDLGDVEARRFLETAIL